MTTGNAPKIDQQANENKLENIKENPQSWTAWKREATRLWIFIRNASIIEIACENSSVKDYMEHWEDRALKAEKKLAALEKPVPFGPAKSQYDKFMAGVEEKDPVERLRFFCSLAMRGQDWINVEPFFNDVQSALQRAQEDRDEARKNYQFMVDRAADEKLDGYRELGAKCAALEQRAEKAEAELKRAQEKAVDDCKLWRDRRDEALTALEKAEERNRRMVELYRDLVVAAEKLTRTSLADNVGRNVSQIAHDELSEALAKLEEA